MGHDRTWRAFDDPAPYRNTCRGKVRHTSKRQANGRRRVMIAKAGARETLETYKCSVCHGWHNGNAVGSGRLTTNPTGGIMLVEVSGWLDTSG